MIIHEIARGLSEIGKPVNGDEHGHTHIEQCDTHDDSDHIDRMCHGQNTENQCNNACRKHACPCAAAHASDIKRRDDPHNAVYHQDQSDNNHGENDKTDRIDEQQNAEGKLERKNFDFIVLNSLNDAGAGFRHDTNKISIIDRKGRTDYPLKSKTEVAQDIIDRLVATLSPNF